MIEWIVSSSILIAIVILLRFVLKGKISLRLQYALWALVLVRLLVPVSFGDTALSVGNLTRKASASEPAQFVLALSETELPRMTYQAAYNEVAMEYADRGIQIEDMPLEEYAETVDYEIMNKMNGDLSIAEVVKTIWICGIVLVGVWFLLSNLRLHRSLKKTRTLLTDSHTLPVYLSDAIDAPCLFGLFHPAIYLTSEAIESEHTERHAVEHELTHFRHKDNIWAILRSVCLAVHWFNPLVWCAAVLSRNDAELSCDESTILRLGEDERASYGRTLIRLTCEKRPTLLNTATTMTGSGNSIRERISLIVKKPKMALYTVIVVVVIAAVAVGCTFTGAKETDTPWNWVQSLSADDITSATPWGGEEDIDALPAEKITVLVQILNGLEKSNFTENTHLTGGTPTYGLTLQTSDGEYHINESIAPSGPLEICYGDKQWWIDAKVLSDFIVRVAEIDISSSAFGDVSELLDNAYGKALHLLDSIENTTSENTISKDTAQAIPGETQYDIKFPVKDMNWFINVTYTRESVSDEWVFSSAKAMTWALPSADTVQEIINRILVGTLSYDESWQSSGTYTLTVLGADGRTDAYSYMPETFYSLMSTPGYYVNELYDWTLTEAWDDDFSNNDYILTVSNDQYSVTVYSNESKIKIQSADGMTAYFIGTPRFEDVDASIQQYEQLFLHFRQYAMYALEAYELYACSVDGSETNYDTIAQELSEQYAQMIPDRPGWYYQQAQDVKVSAVEVFDAYYGEDNPNFCFRMGLHLKMDEEQTRYWQAGAGLTVPPTSGEFAGYYGYGSEVSVRKSDDGRWRMEGFASGGSWAHLPISPEEATTQQLMELFFLSSGHSRDWRILSALMERPLEEIQAQLETLDVHQLQEFISGLRVFEETYPDNCIWTSDEL